MEMGGGGGSGVRGDCSEDHFEHFKSSRMQVLTGNRSHLPSRLKGPSPRKPARLLPSSRSCTVSCALSLEGCVWESPAVQEGGAQDDSAQNEGHSQSWTPSR